MAGRSRLQTGTGTQAWVRTWLALATLGSAWVVAGSGCADPGNITTFARFGDCATPPQDGVPCHFVSALAEESFLQLELTTVLPQGGDQTYLSDILCNVEQAKVKISPGAGRIKFDGKVPASACSFLKGETPQDFNTKLLWTSAETPLVLGTNDCSVTGTVNGNALNPIFCAIDVSSD